MCRYLRTVPVISERLKPSLLDYASVQTKEEKIRKKQEHTFDKQHQGKSLEPLSPGDHVRVMDHQCERTVVEQSAPYTGLLLSTYLSSIDARLAVDSLSFANVDMPN